MTRYQSFTHTAQPRIIRRIFTSSAVRILNFIRHCFAYAILWCTRYDTGYGFSWFDPDLVIAHWITMNMPYPVPYPVWKCLPYGSTHPLNFHTGYGMRYGMFIVIQWAMTKSGSNHTPYHTAYSKIWRMILGRMHALKCTKSVVNHFKNPIEAMVMKEKRLPQITLSLLD